MKLAIRCWHGLSDVELPEGVTRDELVDVLDTELRYHGRTFQCGCPAHGTTTLETARPPFNPKTDVAGQLQYCATPACLNLAVTPNGPCYSCSPASALALSSAVVVPASAPAE